MRRIPVGEVREGTYLARPLYSDSGELLLAQGVQLNEDLLARVERVGFQYIYILDEFSQEEYKEVIQPKVLGEMNRIYNNGLNALSNVRKKAPTIAQRQRLDREVRKMTEMLEQVVTDVVRNNDIVKGLIPISAHDDFTFRHSINVMMLAVALGNSCGLNFQDLRLVGQGTLLHDMGKVFISKEILNKPGKLTEEEMAEVRKHPRDGYDFLRKNTTLAQHSAIIALEHHERWDGTGYPDGKKGTQIHRFSRITTVCDVFEAMSAERPYKRPIPINECREYISAGGGSFFEYDLVCRFIKLINPYPSDCIVRLSDGREGLVAEVNPEVMTRPKLKIYAEDGKRILQPYMVDLMKLRNVTIEAVLPVFSFEKKEEAPQEQVAGEPGKR